MHAPVIWRRLSQGCRVPECSLKHVNGITVLPSPLQPALLLEAGSWVFGSVVLPLALAPAGPASFLSGPAYFLAPPPFLLAPATLRDGSLRLGPSSSCCLDTSCFSPLQSQAQGHLLWSLLTIPSLAFLPHHSPAVMLVDGFVAASPQRDGPWPELDHTVLGPMPSRDGVNDTNQCPCWGPSPADFLLLPPGWGPSP